MGSTNAILFKDFVKIIHIFLQEDTNMYCSNYV